MVQSNNNSDLETPKITEAKFIKSVKDFFMACQLVGVERIEFLPAGDIHLIKGQRLISVCVSDLCQENDRFEERFQKLLFNLSKVSYNNDDKAGLIGC